MDVRCIALDIDGTVLGHSKELSKENKEAILRAMEAGVEVILASGRAFASLPSCLTKIPGIQYAITSNGAAIYHIPSGACIKQYKLSEKSVKSIMEVTQNDSVMYEVFIDGKAYTYAPYVEDPVAFGASAYAVPYIQSTRIPIADMKAFIMENASNLDSLALIHWSQDMVQPIWKKIEREVKGIYITSSVPKVLEIADIHAGKKAGLEYILEYLHLDKENTVAFGNADNDWEMIAFAGLGVAVEDASESCKNAADMITKTCDENGVAYALEKLIKKN